MASEITVQTIRGPASGANANKILIPAGQTLDASSGFIPPAGSVLQVVYGETTAQTSWSSSQSWRDTGITATITPSSASSRILILVDGHFGGTATGINTAFRLVRGSTVIYAGTDTSNKQGFSHFEQGFAEFIYYIVPVVASTVDSPSTASATTYKIEIASNTTGATIYMNRTGTGTSAQSNTRSSIILMEIAG
jgi:hypothetical protein